MSAHTPGPWMVGKVNHAKQRVDIDTKVRDMRVSYTEWRGLARVYGIEDMPKIGSDIMQANARLIAASPELYDAAENALNVIIACCKPTDGVDDAKAIADARTMLCAAIAKAKGG